MASINPVLPTILEKILSESSGPDAVFSALMPALCEVLQCDRCFLYLRNPQTCVGKITHCWVQDSKWQDLTGSDWIKETELVENDPLMAIAFRTSEAVFVKDILTASSETLNLAFEQEYFGHRALIHAPIYQDGQVFGIVEPCIFETSRVWTEQERFIIATVQDKIGPLAAAYVEAALGS